MKRLLIYMKEFRLRAILGPFFKLLEAIFELFVPLLVADIIDVGISAGDRGYILRRVFLMIALGVVGFLSALTAQYFAARTAVGFSARVRKALFDQIQSSSFSELDQTGTSTLITRITGDVNLLQNGVNIALRLLLRSPFIVTGAFVMAFSIHKGISLVFLGVIAVLSLVVWLLMRITVPGYVGVQQKLDRVTLKVRENLYGARVLRSFGKEADETKDFTKENAAFRDEQIRIGRFSSLLNPLTFVVVNIGLILLIAVSGIKVQIGTLSQGEVVALVNYLSQILVELVKFANMVISINRSLASAKRIEAFLFKEEKPDGSDRSEPDLSRPQPFLSFDRVSFTYENAGAESLTDISFTAERGEMIGVIGPTGSGKSTLCSLIPRFYPATKGRILLEGKNIANMEETALRRRIGVVPQKNALFHASIRENLLLGGKKASDENLLSALRSAQAYEVAEEKGGLDAMIEPGGRNLSGGQRQRLCIARALVGDPDLLILDDSASALDFATEARLRAAISSLDQKPLTFLVSQRVSGVMHCDRIFVMEDGRITASGKHEELIRTSPFYAELCRMQLSGEAAI